MPPPSDDQVRRFYCGAGSRVACVAWGSRSRAGRHRYLLSCVHYTSVWRCSGFPLGASVFSWSCPRASAQGRPRASVRWRSVSTHLPLGSPSGLIVRRARAAGTALGLPSARCRARCDECGSGRTNFTAPGPLLAKGGQRYSTSQITIFPHDFVVSDISGAP